MDDLNQNEFDTRIKEIIRDYLYKVSSMKSHDYFNSRSEMSKSTKFFKSSGFGFNILSSSNPNEYVVEEEAFLEGCTRVFLINRVMKLLLDTQQIQSDWRFGTVDDYTTFSINNREFELEYYLEFIADLNGEHIGVRYTTASLSISEMHIFERDFQYLYQKKEIPGFETLKSIDKLFVLDWYGLSVDELSKLNLEVEGIINRVNVVSVEEFFGRFFPEVKYKCLIEKLYIAIEKAKKIISLNAIPQLLPNNMFNFKCSVLDKFTEEDIDALVYEFEDGSTSQISNPNDVAILKRAFFDNGMREALIGKADFAKSFITSEYLFEIIKNGLSIDYTSVVVGYLKSVEQLLYLLYRSAFEGKAGMFYWDRCRQKSIKGFDTSQPDRYRFDPYNANWKQEKYYHDMKSGYSSPEMGELTRFVRYYSKICALSDSGKEFIYKCLEDFRKFDRNFHLHKDNIESSQYSTVERIRNNTHICLYYLLGGFNLLDQTIPENEQIGIVNYRFERLYQEINQKGKRFFNAKFEDGEECVIYYLFDDGIIDFDVDGVLSKAKLYFLKTRIKREEAFSSEIRKLLENESFVKTHAVSIHRDKMPLEIISFIPRKNDKHLRP